MAITDIKKLEYNFNSQLNFNSHKEREMLSNN